MSLHWGPFPWADLLTHDPAALTKAAWTVAAFAGVCLWAVFRGRKPAASGGEILVLYASQTGQAEDIARKSHARLIAGGIDAYLLSCKDLRADHLLTARHILCVAATTGEGDAPDEGMRFERGLMRETLDLSGKTFATLALGDRNYDHFCAFGRRVFDWLERCGALAIVPCLKANDLDPAVLEQWNDLIGKAGGAAAVTPDPFHDWTLTARQHLNPDSEAAQIYQIDLTHPDAAWQAGDLCEISMPDGHVRDYSIASLPREGHVRLYVRQVVGADGQVGQGSGLLTHATPVGGNVRARVKTHKGFHAPAGSGPILLVGAGSGLAGLRAHILEQAGQRPCWLVYGERDPVNDAALCADLAAMQAQGTLPHLDLVFSQTSGDYVQHRLRAKPDVVRAFLKGDGAVLVCGGLAMGRAAEQALRDSLGEDWVDDALADGRYRRDLY